MNKTHTYLLLIFIFGIAFRLFFIFQAPGLSYDSYFALRQVEHIEEYGFPMYTDSISGRSYAFAPLYYYVLAVPYMIFHSTLVLLIINNIIAATLVFVIYLISKYLTDDDRSSLIAAFLSIFSPIYLSETTFNLTPISLVMPLMFLASLNFFKPNKNYLFLAMLLPLIHPISILLVISLAIYYFIAKTEFINLIKGYTELLFFYSLLIIWITILIFKEGLLLHGPKIFWQNAPDVILNNYFLNVPLIDAFSGIGILTLLIGTFSCYRCVFVKGSSRVHYMTMFGILSILLILLRVIPYEYGLIIIGIILTIFISTFFSSFDDYLSFTRYAKMRILFVALLVLVLSLSSFFPSLIFINKTLIPSESDADMLNHLKTSTGSNSVILGPPEYYHLIAYVAERSPLIGYDYLLSRDANNLFEDYEKIYKSTSDFEVISLLDDYNVDYIIIPATQEFSVYSDECYETSYDKDIKVLNVKCRTRTQ